MQAFEIIGGILLILMAIAIIIMAVSYTHLDVYKRQEQNIAECIVAKNRPGETDTVKLAWDGAYTRFGNLEMYRNEE